MARTAPTRRQPDVTRAALIAAARKEFEDPGFDATNTNKIAVRAGFAPQTFYRNFEDKTAIFLAVYRDWTLEEQGLLDGVRDATAAAALVVRHHQASLHFRRALRRLSLTDAAIRSARAESRRLQITRLRQRLPHLAKRSFAELAADLLMLERVTDACAEGEFEDLGIAPAEAAGQVARIIRQSFGKPRP